MYCMCTLLCMGKQWRPFHSADGATSGARSRTPTDQIFMAYTMDRPSILKWWKTSFTANGWEKFWSRNDKAGHTLEILREQKCQYRTFSYCVCSVGLVNGLWNAPDRNTRCVYKLLWACWTPRMSIWHLSGWYSLVNPVCCTLLCSRAPCWILFFFY